MKIKLLSVGKVRKDYIQKGEAEFTRRIQKYCPLVTDQVREERILKNRKSAEIIDREGQRLVKKIPSRSWVVSLDKKGRLYSSEEFARLLAGIMNKGTGYLLFIIGGALGLSSEVKKKSDTLLSLSRMTLTHEMTRLLLLEQIYRSFTILKGENYHK